MREENNPTPLRIGPALVVEGVITPEQLKTALERQERHPSFLLGEIISILFKAPIERIDEITVRRVVTPHFPSALLQRLHAIAQRDKFAKGLVIETFVEAIRLQPRKYEIMHVEARDYIASSDNDGYEKTKVKRYVLTEVYADAIVSLATGDSVRGAVHLKHDSDARELRILEDDDQLKTALYYEMRSIYNHNTAKRPPL